jgi:uncharacterized protein YceK
MKNTIKLMGIIVLIAVIGFGVAACNLLTEEEEKGSPDFNYSGTSTITITSYKGTGPNVIIPSKIDGKPVTAIGDYAFSGCTTLTSVTIPDSVTSIRYGAFWGCDNLISVNIGSNVTSIGWHAFRHCSSLISVTIPNSVTSIGDYAFYNCTSLTNITIPNSVISIGGAAFLGCGDLMTRYSAADGGPGTYTRPSGGTTWTKVSP